MHAPLVNGSSAARRIARLKKVRARVDEDQRERYFAQGTSLNRLLANAPYLPYCSDDKTATRRLPRDWAIRYPYMQINQKDLLSWMIFDLDHVNPWIWEDAGLPPPNLIVRDRVTNKSHVYYAIEPVCTSLNAREAPVRYFKGLYESYRRALKADLDYNGGPVAKTPGHQKWMTTELHNKVYRLGELSAYCAPDLVDRFKRAHVSEEARHSRHRILFDEVRHFAYGIVRGEREHGDRMRFADRILGYARSRNDFLRRGFDSNLSAASLRATAKSIARWTWEVYTGNARCARGIMQADPAMPLGERQRLAAKRTHAERKHAMLGRLRIVCERLVQACELPTQSAIARAAGVARQTVARYLAALQPLISSATGKGQDTAATPSALPQPSPSTPGLETERAAVPFPAPLSAKEAPASALPVTFATCPVPAPLASASSRPAGALESVEREESAGMTALDSPIQQSRGAGLKQSGGAPPIRSRQFPKAVIPLQQQRRFRQPRRARRRSRYCTQPGRGTR